MIHIALLAAALLLAAPAALGETLRIATFNAALSRNGPGLLLRDIERGEDPQIAAVIEVLQQVRPDILLLNEFDYDGGGFALAAFVERLAEGPRGLALPHSFLDQVNTGQPSGLDLDGNGSPDGPADAFGFGRFPGQYGMAVLSRFPIDATATHRFRLLRWAALDWADLPVDATGAPFPGDAAQAVMRLSSKAHWDVAIDIGGGNRLRLFASHPTPPVFDGPEDLNGRRNHDEIAFWTRYLDGARFPSDSGDTAGWDGAAFVILGDLNADPADGDGRRGAIRALLADPRLTDPGQTSAGAVAAARTQQGANTRHLGDPARDTADWSDTPGPGNLRVDYVLPDARLTLVASGVHWPEGPSAAGIASDHRLVWIDVTP